MITILALALLASLQDPAERYDRQEVMLPMRDGVRLYTELYSPNRDAFEGVFEESAPRPIVLLRTPYGVAAADGGFTRYFRSTFRVLAERGYVFAVQDARGRHKSEGDFEWNRPVRHRADAEAIDASTDAYDTIEWLVTHVPGNNGRVGMLGVSYPGWYVTMALVDPHPALAAASPQASPSDYFVGDDFFHFGAFRLSPSAELPYLFDFDPRVNSRFPYDQVDTYEFFLDLGPLSNMNARYLHDVSPTWNAFMEHDTYDEFWRAGATLPHLDGVTVPTLNVVGWWDAENLGGALDIYDRLEPQDEDGMNRIVVGPWSHGQWASAGQTGLGAYDFDSDTSEFYQREVEAAWFAHHLDGGPAPELPEALMFQTGSNEWQSFDAWPPRDAGWRELFLHAGERISFSPPERADLDAYDAYVSDPDRPVPYSKRPIMGFWRGLAGSEEPRFGRAGKLWKVEDQRFVDGRPDVLSYTSEPLEEDLDLTGLVEVRLFASTTGTDCDWVVKLIDVYPEDHEPREMGGFQLMVADDVVRAKFQRSLSDPVAVEPGEVVEYTIDLRTRNHRFRAGHRVMLQVQSSWFPLIDRNPQRFVDIPRASADDFRRAEQRIHASRAYPSRIRLQSR